MKPQIQKRFTFIGKSLLWSLLLYVVLMLAFNWDDVSNTVKGKNEVTIVNTLPPGNANIILRTSITRSIIAILKTITGIATSATAH